MNDKPLTPEERESNERGLNRFQQVVDENHENGVTFPPEELEQQFLIPIKGRDGKERKLPVTVQIITDPEEARESIRRFKRQLGLE